MTVDSKFFSAFEEIGFAATGDGTQVRYVATFTFPGLFAQFAKRFPSFMDGIGKSAMAGMKRALEDQFDVPAGSVGTAVADKLILPGVLRFTRLGYRGARKHWNPTSAYMGDRHVVITGATSGLGLATAEVLASRGAELTLVARDSTKAISVADELKRRFGNPRIHVEIADLCVLAEVDALVHRLLASSRPIHALVNNAGALVNARELTSEGLERSFALLLLSPMRLTEGLQPRLRSSATAEQPSRVINVLSGGMYSQKICVDDLQSAAGTYSGPVAYARAKRGLMILTEEWARSWSDDHIVVHAMHPGWADTPGVVASLPTFHHVTRGLLRSPAEGADTIVWLTCATEAAKTSGLFWLDRLPHAAHMLATTRETMAEREALLASLRGFANA